MFSPLRPEVVQTAPVTVGLVVQVLVSGLAAGAAYGLIGIGFATVYRPTGVLQFAHSELAGAAAYVALVVAAGRAPVTATSVSTGRASLAALVAVLFVAALSALLYLVVLRPFLRARAATAWIGATLALALAIQGALYVLLPREAVVFPDIVPFVGHAPLSLGSGVVLPVRTISTLVFGLIVAVIATAVLERTRLGKALSAIADEPLGAQITGLPVDRLVAVGFALSGALAAIAGIVNAPLAGAPPSSVLSGLKGIVAALLAGLGSPRRVFAWALGIGVLESAVAGLHVPGLPSLALGPAWRDLAPMLLLLGWLALKPGRFGREPSE